MTATRPELTPISAAEVTEVAAFLHSRLNSRVAASAWRAVLQPPWGADPPNSGFLLRNEGRIVGAYAAVYADRDDVREGLRTCNLAAFVVEEEHRAHSLRLVRAVLAQPGFVFTDLSPSGNVPAMNDRLGFTRFDVRTRLVVNGGGGRRPRAVVVTGDDVRDVLSATDRRLFDDHRGASAAHHLAVVDDEGYAYLVYRRDRRKRLPVFATPLYVGGEAGVLERNWAAVSRRLLSTGHLATLAEPRVLGFAPRGAGLWVRHPRPRMLKAKTPGDELERLDYLYSELALLAW
ncbi:hypothetical protein N3K63_01670 [Microbacterium sp. W1N]|uniref:hypothetical protein n=1 Tax=Microbacterium festucae TaxID=2977531 RepID=UPI0021BFBFAD|nr:hypothetical protein [Microbacterium festucae]MCT9818988.1 hypothetical protein [Microbacterium festucae]